MHKTKILFTLLLIALITACSSGPATSGPTSLPTLALPTAAQQTGEFCSAFTAQPTPNPDQPSLFPKVSESDHVLGIAQAPVTLIVYSDFQCAECRAMAVLLERTLSRHPADMRIVFRAFPLIATNDKAALAAVAAEAASEQGKFWDMHNYLFNKQPDWYNLSVEDFQKWLIATAPGELNLDAAAFAQALIDPDIIARVQAQYDFGAQNQLPAPPLLLINGQIQLPPYDAHSLDQIVSLLALGQRQYTECPQYIIDPGKQYIATLKTEKGDIVAQLFADKVPNTVNNFVFLAQNKWYDNITFHRVLPGLIVQTGDPSGTGLGNPGFFIPNESAPALKFDRAGLLGMFNSGPDTNGSQFFITLAPQPQFDGKYTLFGEVIGGLDVLAKLAPRDPQPGILIPAGDPLLTITIEVK